MIIIAASIPHLRFALKETSIHSRTYEAGGHRLDDPSRYKLEGTTKQTSKGTTIELARRHDNQSDKSILGDTGDGARDIIQTASSR